jgi:hypothetical protein
MAQVGLTKETRVCLCLLGVAGRDTLEGRGNDVFSYRVPAALRGTGFLMPAYTLHIHVSATYAWTPNQEHCMCFTYVGCSLSRRRRDYFLNIVYTPARKCPLPKIYEDFLAHFPKIKIGLLIVLCVGGFDVWIVT